MGIGWAANIGSSKLPDDFGETYMSNSLSEAAQSYVRSKVILSRPYYGLKLTIGETEFIQAMREQGFINNPESELIEAFKEAKKQADEFFENYLN